MFPRPNVPGSSCTFERTDEVDLAVTEFGLKTDDGATVVVLGVEPVLCCSWVKKSGPELNKGPGCVGGGGGGGGGAEDTDVPLDSGVTAAGSMGHAFRFMNSTTNTSLESTSSSPTVLSSSCSRAAPQVRSVSVAKKSWSVDASGVILHTRYCAAAAFEGDTA